MSIGRVEERSSGIRRNPLRTPDLNAEIEKRLGEYWMCGTTIPDAGNLSPTDWMIENHPEVWMKVVKEYWEGIPLDFGNIDPDESYFIKKCFEEIDRKRAQV